jgi:AcrR family transcriptional regulator
MSGAADRGAWREGRRQSARAAIVEAAWEAVREQGLAGLSMRDLASRAGITTPTVYAYFESKNDIYDAMFGQAAAEFAAHMSAPYAGRAPLENLVAGARRFVQFCTDDVARYQLLFQRTIPDFEPSPESYAHAIEALEGSRRRLAANGIAEPRHLDIWTALVTGLVDQQISNDPGGERWLRLIDESVEMFFSHCQRPSRSRTTTRRTSPRRSGTPQRRSAGR